MNAVFLLAFLIAAYAAPGFACTPPQNTPSAPSASQTSADSSGSSVVRGEFEDPASGAAADRQFSSDQQKINEFERRLPQEGETPSWFSEVNKDETRKRVDDIQQDVMVEKEKKRADSNQKFGD